MNKTCKTIEKFHDNGDIYDVRIYEIDLFPLTLKKNHSRKNRLAGRTFCRKNFRYKTQCGCMLSRGGGVIADVTSSSSLPTKPRVQIQKHNRDMEHAYRSKR